MLVKLTIVNETQHVRIYDEIEEWGCDSVSKVYRRALQEYGRPRSKVYIDAIDAPPREVGWVFKKRVKYHDCNETFLQTTWVCPVTVAPRPNPEYVGI